MDNVRSLITATVTDAHGRVMEAALVLTMEQAMQLTSFTDAVRMGDKTSGPLTLKQAAKVLARFAP